MKLGRLPWQHVTDAEYIAKIRRNIELTDRFRWLAILLGIGMLAAVVWLFMEVQGRIIGLLNGANPAWVILGFSTGAVIGMTFGWMIHGILHNLIFNFFGSLRSERLLLRYYDAFNEQNRNQDERLENATET